jgi:hypothetical protein
MSAGSLMTEEQRERHNAACRDRYRAKKAADPLHNQKVWKKKKARMIEAGTLDRYMDRTRQSQKLIYERKIKSGTFDSGEKDRIKRARLVMELGGKCVHCGFDADIRVLVLDHKNSDGHLDRRRIGNHIARYYISRIDEAKKNLQVLCFNCNWIKAIEAKEHNISRRRN